MEACLLNGTHVAFRQDQREIWLRQGTGDHQRTNHYGVVLSVRALEGDVSDLAQRINKGRFIYIMKASEVHGSYASFHSYRYPPSIATPCVDPLPSPVESSADSSLATRGAYAISYGGGVLLVQSLWWAARNVAWFRYPILIPLVVFIAALPGLTPTLIADTIMELVFTPFKALGKWASRLSYTWLADPWLWIVPIIILVIWGLSRLSPAGLEPESEDSPMMRKQVPISATPLATQPEPKPPVLSVPRCTALLIRCRGDPTKPLISAPCSENGSFLIPLADGDTVADTILDTDVTTPRPFPAASVCAKHATLYRTHVHQCTCSTPKCQTIGLPFHVDSEVFYECVHHSAERVIKDQIPTDLAKRAKTPGPRTPPDSPPMPSLGPITVPSDSMRLSGSSGSISTGISIGELPVKMKEIGGRVKDTPLRSLNHNPNRIANLCYVLGIARAVGNGRVTLVGPVPRKDTVRPVPVHHLAVHEPVRTLISPDPLLIHRDRLLPRNEGSPLDTRSPIDDTQVLALVGPNLRNKNFSRAGLHFLALRSRVARLGTTAQAGRLLLKTTTKRWLIDLVPWLRRMNGKQGHLVRWNN